MYVEDDYLEFAGELDHKTLGGAGFAAQRTVDDYRPPDLSNFDALVLDIPHSDGKKYTIILKDTLNPKTREGREAASVSWEHDFHLPGFAGSGRVILHFDNFKPFYRGKPVENSNTPPIDRRGIRRIAIMVRR